MAQGLNGKINFGIGDYNAILSALIWLRLSQTFCARRRFEKRHFKAWFE